jgi:hypothetical protein
MCVDTTKRGLERVYNVHSGCGRSPRIELSAAEPERIVARRRLMIRSSHCGGGDGGTSGG